MPIYTFYSCCKGCNTRLGRMLSPDNQIQAPANSQSYNRYSYCLNNPLILTDPSGWASRQPIGYGLGGQVFYTTTDAWLYWEVNEGWRPRIYHGGNNNFGAPEIGGHIYMGNGVFLNSDQYADAAWEATRSGDAQKYGSIEAAYKAKNYESSFGSAIRNSFSIVGMTTNNNGWGLAIESNGTGYGLNIDLKGNWYGINEVIAQAGEAQSDGGPGDPPSIYEHFQITEDDWNTLTPEQQAWAKYDYQKYNKRRGDPYSGDKDGSTLQSHRKMMQSTLEMERKLYVREVWHDFFFGFGFDLATFLFLPGVNKTMGPIIPGNMIEQEQTQ